MQSLVIRFWDRQICTWSFVGFWRGYFGYCWTTSFPSLPQKGERESESLGARLISGIIFSDQLEFSPNNITEYIIKRTDHENYKMSHHQMENALIFYKILSTSFLNWRNVWDISVENLQVDIGALRVNADFLFTKENFLAPSPEPKLEITL